MGPRNCKALPPAQTLWDLFSYNPLKGNLYNRLPRGSRSRIGAIAGSYDTRSGYTTIDIKGSRYLLHRAIYKWVTGAEPGECVDHVGQEGVKPKYNAFHALANVNTRTSLVRARLANKQSPLSPGVRKNGRTYTASIRTGGKCLYLGVYATEMEAACAYADAAAKISFDSAWRPNDAFYVSNNRLWGSSKYRGVCFHKQTGKWRAQLLHPVSKKVEHLGLFATEYEAFQCVAQIKAARDL
jgi:hypothetical protein